VVNLDRIRERQRMRTKHDPIGFTYHASAYCYECGVVLPETDPEGNDKHPIAPWEEFYWQDSEGNDRPYTCAECGVVI
jgi:hypothetical protein